MADFATVVERVEMSAEHRGRRRMIPEPHIAARQALERYGYHATTRELDILNMRYWMFYAAGLYDQDEAADVTIRRWRGEN